MHALELQPEVDLPPEGNRSQRQVSRMIKHLRDHVYAHHVDSPMPTGWLIEQLVINALPFELPENCNWQNVLRQTLQRIKSDTAQSPCRYTTSNNHRPLFPNHELLDEWEVYQFICCVLGEVEKMNT